MTRASIPNLDFPDRAAWRSWLAEHHDKHPGAWLVFRKGPSAVGRMTYEDALEEALCFGWIDSVIKRLDEQRYVRKFTPRTNTGKWSSANLTRVQTLINDGRMTPAGLRKLQPGSAPQVRFSERRWTMPSFFRQALRKNSAAQRYFNQLAPSYKRAYIAWLSTAKRPETRARRLKEAMALLAAGKKLGPR